MTCEDFRAELDRLDSGQSWTASTELREHATQCQDCTGLARRQDHALELCLQAPARLDRDLTQRIMAEIALQGAPHRTIALRFWLVAGLVLLSAGLLPPLSRDYHHLVSFLGNGFLIPLMLVSGLAISAYMLIFVGTHLAGIGTYLRKHHLFGY